MTEPRNEGRGAHPDEAVLHELLEGELGPEAEAGARRHLASCEACRELLGELGRLRARARALPRDVEPQRDLWAGIETRIGEGTPGTAEDAGEAAPSPSAPRARVSPRRGPAERRVGRPRRGWPRGPAWGLAAAAGLAGIVAAGLLLTAGPDRAADGPAPVVPRASSALLAGELQEVDDAYRPVIDELRSLADARELTPETREVLEENLALIERAIEESREAVRADPQGHLALENLQRMYDAKVETLRIVAVRQ